MGFPKFFGRLFKSAKTVTPVTQTAIPAVKTAESLPAIVKPITVTEPVVSTVKPVVQGYQIQRFPGYQLKSLMSGNPLEKQLSKTGTISTASIDALSKKMSAVEQAVIGKVLAEKFPGQKAIDYNDFRKDVQDELITYDRTPDTRYNSYGTDRLGFNEQKLPDGNGSLIEYVPGLKTRTYIFSSPRIPHGSAKHYDANTLGHSRTYTTADEPDVLHVMESQSDWAQQAKRGKIAKDVERASSQYKKDIDRANALFDENVDIEEKLARGVRPDGTNIEHDYEYREIREIIERNEQTRKTLLARTKKYDMTIHPEKYVQEVYLQDNYTSRQIQKNLRYAAEQGQTRMRYPTRETAAKIEGYPEREAYYNETGDDITTKQTVYTRGEDTDKNLEWLLEQREGLRNRKYQSLLDAYEAGKSTAEPTDDVLLNTLIADPNWIEVNRSINDLKKVEPYLKPGITKKIVYDPAYEPILKRYSDFPKQFGKLFKGAPVRTIQDLHGNTWYEVDVPKDYLQMEWPYKDGGSIPSIFKEGGILKGQNGLAKLFNTVKGATKTGKKLTVAERLGIPKSLRGSSNAIMDTYYWGYPQWNAAYYKSIADGDDKTTQILRDLHFKLKAPNTKVVDESGMPLHLYHGTSEREITQLDPSKRGANTGSGFYTDPNIGKKIPIDSENTFSFSSSKSTAASYKYLARWNEIMRHKRYYDNIYAAITNIPYVGHKLTDIEKAEQRSFIDNILSPKLGYDLRKTVNEGLLTDTQKSELITKIQSVRKKINAVEQPRWISNMQNNLETDIKNLNILKQNKDKILSGESISDYDFDNMSMSFVSGYGNPGSGDVYEILSKDADGKFKVSGRPIDEQEFNRLVKSAEKAIQLNRDSWKKAEKVNGYDTFGDILDVYMNSTNPLMHDYHGSAFPDIYYVPTIETDKRAVRIGTGELVRPLKVNGRDIPTGYIAARQVRKAMNSGNDAVVYKNIVDPFVSDTYGIFDPKRVKFSAPITRTDSGEIIPIVKRDNFHISDLRYDNGGVLKAQKGKVIKAIGEAVKGSSKPALVKYYAPTMGKTFAAKSNPLLVDFDDIIREPSKQILDTYGFKSKSDMYNSGNTDAISSYENMLIEKLNGLRTNPQYNGKTVVVSPTAVANPDKIGFRYDNIPSIPVKSIFIERNVGRGGTPGASEMWYDSLMRQYPGFNIENRFVSELEPMPTNEQWDALYNAAVESGNMEEVQRLRDMHFKVKTPDNKLVNQNGDLYKVWHGSPEEWTVFDDRKRGLEDVIYFSTDKLYADQFTIPKKQWMIGMTPTKSSRSFYLYGKTPLNVGSDMVSDLVQEELMHDWMNGGNADSVYGLDLWTQDMPLKQSKGTEFGVLRRNQMKLADHITYDDNGNIIPLSKRDNFSNPDIRYGIIPLVGLGLGAAATQKEKNGGTIKSIFNEIHN